MSKTVKFAKPKRDVAASADAWVAERAGAGEPEEPMKRFTIDVKTSLHARVKAGCAMRGVKMADVIREFLEKEFPGEKP